MNKSASATLPRVRIPYERQGAEMTFRDFARDHLRSMQQLGYSLDTINLYDRRYLQFLAYVKARGGQDAVRSFNDETVMGFAEYLGQQRIHPNTIISTLSTLASLAKYGMMRRDERGQFLLSKDPTKTFRWPMHQHQETKFCRPDELAALIAVQAPPWKRIPLDIFIETGIRAGEAARLNVEDFTEVSGRYFLSIKRKGRGQQMRVEKRDIPVSKALGKALADWLLARGAVHPDLPLLVNHEGHRWGRSSISGMIARLAHEAGVTRLRVSSHKLRHTANVIARRAGLDPATRARRFGHSSLQSQERYDHVLPDELHQATETYLTELGEYIGGPDRRTPKTEPPERNEDARIVNDDGTLRDA